MDLPPWTRSAAAAEPPPTLLIAVDALSSPEMLQRSEKKREKKKTMFVADCSAFIYILSHTQGVESAWSLLQGPEAA